MSVEQYEKRSSPWSIAEAPTRGHTGSKTPGALKVQYFTVQYFTVRTVLYVLYCTVQRTKRVAGDSCGGGTPLFAPSFFGCWLACFHHSLESRVRTLLDPPPLFRGDGRISFSALTCTVLWRWWPTATVQYCTVEARAARARRAAGGCATRERGTGDDQ